METKSPTRLVIPISKAYYWGSFWLTVFEICSRREGDAGPEPELVSFNGLFRFFLLNIFHTGGRGHGPARSLSTRLSERQSPTASCFESKILSLRIKVMTPLRRAICPFLGSSN